MIDHCSLDVRDLARSMACYDALLAPLRAAHLWNDLDAAGYGRLGKPTPSPANDRATRSRRTLARIWPLRQQLAAVDALHADTLRCRGTSDGEPGFHTEYGPGYDASFVTDPDGHRLEAVRHETRAATP